MPTSADTKLPIPAAHALLLGLAILPLLVTVPSSVNVVVVASLCVYVGCWRSVKPLPPVESLTQKVNHYNPCKLPQSEACVCSPPRA